MYRISLKDVGTPLVTEDINCDADTLGIALFKACKICYMLLRHRDFTVKRIGEDEYALYDGQALLGSFTITKLY